MAPLLAIAEPPLTKREPQTEIQVQEARQAAAPETYWALVPDGGLMALRPVRVGSPCPRCGEPIELWLGPGDHEYSLACGGWACGYQLEILRNP